MLQEKHRSAFDNEAVYDFCREWIQLKFDWLAGARTSFALRIVRLGLMHPLLTGSTNENGLAGLVRKPGFQELFARCGLAIPVPRARFEPLSRSDEDSNKMKPAELIAKSVREPRKAVSTLLHRLLSPIGHRSYRRFVVLTRDRTGSNMLIQSLNSHPNIAADYEIFGKLNGESEKTILDRSFSKQPFYIKAKGFKIFYYHPQDADSSPIWRCLRRSRIFMSFISSGGISYMRWCLQEWPTRPGYMACGPMKSIPRFGGKYPLSGIRRRISNRISGRRGTGSSAGCGHVHRASGDGRPLRGPGGRSCGGVSQSDRVSRR